MEVGETTPVEMKVVKGPLINGDTMKKMPLILDKSCMMTVDGTMRVKVETNAFLRDIGVLIFKKR